jgi:hypothetical protein
MTSASHFNDASAAEDFGRRWNQFWFTPTDALGTSMLRIAIGLITAIHFISLSSQIPTWYAPTGVLSPAAVAEISKMTSGGAGYHYSHFNFISSPAAAQALHWLAIIVALTFTAGLLTRISGVLTLLALLSYIHRVPQVASHLDGLLCFLLFYLCIAPAGTWLSVDRILFGSQKNKSLWFALGGSEGRSVTARISLSLIQVHLAMFYAMLGLTKLYGDAWWDGSAIWALIAQTQSRPLDLTGIRKLGTAGEYLLNFWAHSIVYFELAFPILIWTRPGRPILLALSFLIWISILLIAGHTLFCLAMLAANLAFIPPEALRSLFPASSYAASDTWPASQAA